MKAVSERAPLHPVAWFGIIAAATFVGGSCALLVQSQLAPSEARRLAEVEPASATPDQALLETMKQLIDEFRADSADRSTLDAPVPVPQRTVASELGAESSSELAAALQALRTTIQELGIGRPTATRPAPTLPPSDHRGWLPEPPAGIPAGGDVSMRFHARQHLFWSEQQVLDAYGRPDGISANGPGISTWFYRDEHGTRSFRVFFQDGRVTGIDMIRRPEGRPRRRDGPNQEVSDDTRADSMVDYVGRHPGVF